MDTTEINWLMVRAFNRVWNPISEQLSIWAECDSQFDGGEWSGPANANTMQLQYAKCLESVAAKFHMDFDVLERMIEKAGYIEYDKFREAVQRHVLNEKPEDAYTRNWQKP